MLMIKYKKILFIIYLSLVFNQSWTPFHKDELNRYSNIQIDYQGIDMIARENLLINYNRQTFL